MIGIHTKKEMKKQMDLEKAEALEKVAEKAAATGIHFIYFL